MTSNMIYIVALGVGFKCPRKIHLNTQCPQPHLTGHRPPIPICVVGTATDEKSKEGTFLCTTRQRE